MRGGAVFALLLLAGAEAVGACSCAERPPAEHYQRAEAVFTGYVASVERQDERLVAAVTVSNVWRGGPQLLPATTVLIATPAETSLCGFPFAAGENYLIYARGETTDLCSGTKPIQQATEQGDFEALPPAAKLECRR